jgi:hypothetical protein
MPALSPSSRTATVRRTAATMTTPSFTLIDERKSSGLTRALAYRPFVSSA